MLDASSCTHNIAYNGILSQDSKANFSLYGCRTVQAFFITYAEMHLLRSKRRGRCFGAYYSKTLAIWNDDTSIKNGSLAKLIQRIGSVLALLSQQREMTKGVECRRKTSISLTLAHSLGTLVKTILRGKSA